MVRASPVASSWCLPHFWPEDLAHEEGGAFRLCKHCWPSDGEQRPTSVADLADPGRAIRGCIKYGGSSAGGGKSPGSMAKRLKRHHGIANHAAALEDADGGGGVGDPSATKAFVRNVVVQDLQDLRTAARPGAKAFYATWLKKPLQGRSKMREYLSELAAEAGATVRAKVRRQRAGGGRFAVSADAWKTKGRRPRSYLAVNLHWVNGEWQTQEACAVVYPLRGQKTQKRYRLLLDRALQDMELEPCNLVAAVSDHEGAIRCALASLAPVVGCQCHFFQLSPKHVLPPLRPPRLAKRKAAQMGAASSSESESSSTSTSSGDSEQGEGARGQAREEDEAAASGGPTLTYPRLRKTDPERVRLIEQLTPLAQTIRATIKWFHHHPDEYTEMEETADAAGVPRRAFAAELPTRWDTTFLSWSSYLSNLAAFRLWIAKTGRKDVPLPIGDEQASVVVDILTVLNPTRAATLEQQRHGDRSLASQYLPLLAGLLRLLGPCTTAMRKPEGCGPWSATPDAPSKTVADMDQVAQDLRQWLHADFLKMKEKHLAASQGEGHKLLKAASYLDPRFKRIGRFLDQEEVQPAIKDAKALAVKFSEAGREAQRLQGERPPSSSTSPAEPARPAARDDDDAQLLGSLTAKGRAKAAKAEAKAAKAKAKAEAARRASLRGKAPENALEKPGDLPSLAEELLYGSAPQLEAPLLGNLAVSVKDEARFYESQAEWRGDAGVLSPLAWWRDRSAKLPHLGEAARALLCIPGASASLERAFSHGGRAIDYRRRPRLGKTTACETLFAHENLLHGHL